MIRDQALAVGGLLVEQARRAVGEAVSAGGAVEGDCPGQDYVQDNGDELYRRSLYTFWKRTIAPPVDDELRRGRPREPASVRETRTNTPLQALNLMNDVTYRRSGAHAGRADDEGRRRSAEERIALAFRLATGARRRRRAKRRSCSDALSELSGRLSRPIPKRRRSISAQGESPRDEELDASELAAYTARRQPDPEPGRDDHEGVTHGSAARATSCMLTRRHFFGRPARASALAALATLLSDDLPRRGGATGGAAGLAAFRAQGQARHLPVSVGRPVAAGPVRLQAAA